MCNSLLLISLGQSEMRKFLALRIHVFVLATCESKPEVHTMIVSEKSHICFILRVCEDARCCAFGTCNSSASGCGGNLVMVKK